jgi:CRP-like cAMP-binding protein
MKRIKSYKLFKESQEINGSEIYTIEEGCGKVYHGGKSLSGADA